MGNLEKKAQEFIKTGKLLDCKDSGLLIEDNPYPYFFNKLPEEITIENCEFDNIWIKTPKKRITIKNCKIGQQISIESDIDSIFINNLANCESINIEKGNIKLFKINNSQVKNLIAIDDILFLEKLLIKNSQIENSTLCGKINTIDFFANSNLKKIECYAKLKELVLTNKTEDCYRNISEDKTDNTNLIEKVKIIESDDAHYFLDDINIKNLEFIGLHSNSEIRIFGAVTDTIILRNSIKYANIKSCKIKDSFLISNGDVSQLIMSNIDLSNTKFILNDSYLNRFRWLNMVWSKDVALYNNNSNQIYTSRDVLRLLKHIAKEQDSQIDALNFHSLEMEAYRRELNNKTNKRRLFVWIKKVSTTIKKWIIKKQWEDKIILHLNKYSNNHGLSWWRGFLFTLVVGFIFFSIYTPILLGRSLDFSWDGISEWGMIFKNHIKYYPAFLNPAHSFKFMKSVSTNYFGWSLVVDTLGRIAVGFGIYQTIQAFRKYGRF
ncbi:MAG: hypothetical protein KAT68_18930 [Bacteroidales bacterium]|nr:hypothetical protein [Bacteroidales bacterium]